MTPPEATQTPQAAPTEAAAPAAPAAAAPAATPAAETTPAAEAAAAPATDDAAPKTEQPAGAPESYADFTMPEGVALDADGATNLKALAKELNLTQDQAQKVADIGGQLAQKWSAAHAEAIQATVAQWAKDAKADKEIGGAKFEENLGIAKKAINKFGGEKLVQMLEETGLGNHPELIRVFNKIGREIGDDTVVTGQPGASTRSVANILYGSKNQ